MDNKKKELYDLEERTFLFAQNVRALVKKLSKTVGNIEDGKQVVRSSGSVGANYIEAQEYTGAKDRVLRIKISRKESEESRFWLRLVDVGENKSGIDLGARTPNIRNKQCSCFARQNRAVLNPYISSSLGRHAN